MSELRSPWLPRDTRRQQQDIKREAVLAVAARVLGERGYAATRIDDIAAELHVTKPTVYYYYRTKEALYLACIERAMTELADTMSRVESNASVSERVAAFLAEYVKLMTSDLGKCLVMISEFDLGPKAQKRLLSAKREVDAALDELIKEGMRKGVFEARDPTTTRCTLFGAMSSVARWYKPGGRLEAESLIATVRDVLMQGLRKRSRS